MGVVTNTQIANRALQRVGAKRIADGLLLTENSKNASEVRACFDILRRAEMRRNVWRFSIRTVALRPIDSDSKFVAFGTWAIGTTYAKNDIVTGSDGQTYISLAGTNLAHTPTTSPTWWTLYFGPMVAQEFVADDAVSYLAGELVYVSTALYVSLENENTDTPPSSKWQAMTTLATMSLATFIYPIGTGPASQTTTKNVFRLPNGFLRTAPQEPKAGSYMPLGAPSALSYADWNYESDYLTSSEPNLILFRFAADISDPTQFDPLFVEGLASRIAFEVCEPLTQSTAKLQAIASEYKQFISDARIVNGIELGPTEAPEDSYITSQR